MYTRTCLVLATLWLGAIVQTVGQTAPAASWKLWFNKPAAGWNEALPVGNGRVGAMVFGTVQSERLQLNEESVWTGKPEDFINPGARAALPVIRKLLFAGKYVEAQQLAIDKMMGHKTVNSSYQTAGDLWLTFPAQDGEPEGYERSLDLETALARVQYRQGGVAYTRETFSSAPDQVMVVRLTADRPGALSLQLALTRPGSNAAVTASGSDIILQEHTGGGVGVKLVTRLRVIPEGGSLSVGGTHLAVEKADAVTVLVAIATDYNGADPQTTTQRQLTAAAAKRYEDLKRAHIQDYQAYFNRVALDLGVTNAVYFPTDARISAVQRGNDDPHLAALYFQLGRYLLISSSRPGGLPANLQGIWADGLTPPWSADYHININIQMNYWLAEVANLPELHLPFITFLDRLRPDARKTAKAMYGIDGTVAHFTTDPWLFTAPYGYPSWAMWPMGMTWCAQHVWEHYAFTGDKAFLQQYYPILKESATFCAQWLVENPATGKLVSGPSISPENTFQTADGHRATMVMGPTMDHMIIRDLLTSTLLAQRVLQRDEAFGKQLEKILTKLSPTQIGADGRILEWTEAFQESEPGHRHISHLYGLHPGKEITRKQPELFAAARKTIDYRLAHGGGHTGWSRAWIVNFFARLGDGEAAHENLVALFKKSTLPNLFDNHPPFQIDGNFGAPAGIAEMLLQSHDGSLTLLPALPKAWPTGNVRGLCARGGFEVSMQWSNGVLNDVALLSKLGGACVVQYGSKRVTLQTEKGKVYTLRGDLTAR
jgi:alpha-L-fucosidase 2